MPGVNVTTAVRSGPVGTNDVVAGQLFVVGEAERGPTDEPTLLRSFSDYTTYYGNYQSGSLYAHVKTYFDEGGARCYVMRVAGGSSAAGSITLNNSSGSATMDITAKNVGAWAGNLTVAVLAADVSGFRLQVALDSETLLTTRDLTSVTDGVNVINTSSVAHLVEAADNTTATGNPATVAAAALSGGSNGSAVSDANIVSALATDTTKLSPNLKSGAIAAPGRGKGASADAIWTALRDHAAANNRVALLGFNSGTAAGTAKTEASAYYADAKASYMAFYWPEIKVPVPGSSELATGTSALAGATLTIDPVCYAAGARAKAIAEVGGPWRAGAGQISSAMTIKDLASDVTPATGDALDNARVNAIRKIGDQIRVYGARSVSNDEANWRYITMRDTMNYITLGIEDRMEQYVFETIDGSGNLFGRIRGSIKAFLEPIRIAGGLYEAYDVNGQLIDPGYNVIVNGTINPATQLATGLVKAQVGVRVSGVADLIDIVITKSNLSAPLI
jgi:hypothetical protein